MTKAIDVRKMGFHKITLLLPSLPMVYQHRMGKSQESYHNRLRRGRSCQNVNTNMTLHRRLTGHKTHIDVLPWSSLARLGLPQLVCPVIECDSSSDSV